MFSPYQLSSDCKNYPPEGAALNEITQSLSRFGQRERLRHDRFDRTGLTRPSDALHHLHRSTGANLEVPGRSVRLSALGLRPDQHGSVKQIHHEALEVG